MTAQHPSSSLSFLVNALSVSGSVVSVMFYHQEEWLCTVLVLLFLLVALSYNKFHTSELAIALAGAVLGPLAESACIWAGAWHYTDVSMLNIPFWLIPAWAGTAVICMRAGKTLSRKFGG